MGRGVARSRTVPLPFSRRISAPESGRWVVDRYYWSASGEVVRVPAHACPGGDCPRCERDVQLLLGGPDPLAAPPMRWVPLLAGPLP